MTGICKTCGAQFEKPKKTSSYCTKKCAGKALVAQARKLAEIRWAKTGKRGVVKKCESCGGDFYVPRYREQTALYCSRSCLAKIHLRQFLPVYGFQKTGNPPHRYKYRNENKKKIYEHREIIESFLGRKLESWEHVHHINGDSLDNRPENLQVVSNSEHQRLELRLRRLPPRP